MSFHEDALKMLVATGAYDDAMLKAAANRFLQIASGLMKEQAQADQGQRDRETLEKLKKEEKKEPE